MSAQPDRGVLVPLPPEWIELVAERAAQIVAARDPVADSDPWLSVAEAAAHLSTTPDRIHQLVYRRRLTPDGYDGRRPLFRRSTLDRYLEGA